MSALPVAQWDDTRTAYDNGWTLLAQSLIVGSQPVKRQRIREWWDATIGEALWSKQYEIMDAVDDHRFTSIASCHGIGKSFVMAGVVEGFLHTRPNSVALTTAPTNYQVENVLWRYIRTIHGRHRAKLLGKALTKKLDIAEDWYGLGFKPANNETDRFQGFHADHILVVIDEAAGVPDSAIDVLHATMTSRNARFVMIGNPTSVSGRYRQSFHEHRSTYHTIRIPAESTPNFTGESDAPHLRHLKDALITPEFVVEETAIHGADSDYIRSRVHAEFPQGTSDTLIAISDVETCEANAGDAELQSDDDRYFAGIDVARFGDDESAIDIRYGLEEIAFRAWQGADITESAKRVREQLDELEPWYPGITAQIEIRVDVIGLGAGLADRLREAGLKVVDVSVSSASSDKTKWPNLRHELWSQLADRYRAHRIMPSIDPRTRQPRRFDERMKAQLVSIKKDYSDASYTGIMIEKKDAYKKRTGMSPDRAEAQVLCYATLPQGERRGGPVVVRRSRGKGY